MSNAAAELEKSITKNKQMQGLADAAVGGVTISFLAQTFRMDHQKVKRKLVNCPVKRRQTRGTMQVQHWYDLAEAASYLVDAKINPEDVISKMRREDLPPSISTAYWDAQLKRQKWEEQAGQLWRTETISSVIGSMFQTIKFEIQLWADTLERQTGLTEEQREVLNGMTDQLQQSMFNSLRENAEANMSKAQIGELEEMLIRADRDPREKAYEAMGGRESVEVIDEDDDGIDASDLI